MHQNAFNFVAKTVRSTTCPDGLVLEIGGRHINGSIRDLFTEPYIAIDIADGPGVDVVADGATYRPKTKAAVVVCCEVLEHTAKAAAICRNAHRMLKACGVFIVTAASDGRAPHSAVDGGACRRGEFYQNVSPASLRQWLAPFRQRTVTVNHDTHDVYAVAIKGR